MATPSKETLLDFVNYDPSTGAFTWSKDVGRKLKAGGMCGSMQSKGYIELRVAKTRILAHRAAWLIQTGQLPNGQVDHVNGVKTDNTWTNLRAATASQNQHNKPKPKNNTSGFKGVTWNKRRMKWRVAIKIEGRSVTIGHRETPEEAAAMHQQACLRLHREFANVN